MESLLVELVTEELPPKSLKRLGEAFAQGIFEELGKAEFLGEGANSEMFCSPRRLAVRISSVRNCQPDREVARRGPAVGSGLDADGQPTKALLGFARSCGVEAAALERSEENGGEYFVFRSLKRGEPLGGSLADIVAKSLKRLPAPKVMRWGDREEQFIRPVHSLAMLLGDTVVPGNVLGLESGRVSRGHRFHGAGPFDIPSASAYESTLAEKGGVMVSFQRRRQMIEAELTRLAAGVEVVGDDALLDEVASLVEWPAVYEGCFDEGFLEVPSECLVLSMQQHQRYFPLRDATGKLLSRFLVVSNTRTEDPSAIVAGNERVLKARLSDARFFFDTDRRTPLAERVTRLAQVVYYNRLGSQHDRVQRLMKLAAAVAQRIGADAALAERAAYLAKADLLTEMVGEFPELQGLMGRYYALHDGETPAVAEAVADHYRPRFAGDDLPASGEGAAVAMADRLDALVGFFGIGQIPTGEKDPFALRRQALGVVRMLVDGGLVLDLPELLSYVAALFPDGVLADSVADDVYRFILERLRHLLRERGFDANTVESVLSLDPARLDLVPAKLEAVAVFRTLPEAEALAAANKRIGNILKKTDAVPGAINASRLVEAAEKALHARMIELEPLVAADLGGQDFQKALARLATVRPEVDAFFDGVMVMADDPALKENRLALLGALWRTMNQVADLSALA